MTRSLLYPPAPEDAAVDAFAPGLDMVPASDDAIPVEVLCPAGRSVPEGFTCANPDPVICIGCHGACDYSSEEG